MKRILLLLSLSLVSLGLVGCGSSNSGASGFDGGFVATGGGNTTGFGDLVFNFVQAQETTTTVPLGTVKLKFDFYNAGNTIVRSETLDYAAQIVFEDVSSLVVRVVVTAINGDGFPIAEGTADLTIPPGSEQEVELAISAVTLDALVVSPDSVSLSTGASQQLLVQGFWSNGFIANIDSAAPTYAGNAAGIATVSATGLVTGVAAGSTSVTVSYTVAGTTTEVSSSPVLISVVGGPILLSGADNIFNTDTGELNGAVHPGWNGTSLVVESFDIPEGARLNVTGTAAFQLTTRGDIAINGTLNAFGQTGVASGGSSLSGAGGVAGPGGFNGGAGGGTDRDSLDGETGAGPGGATGGQGATLFDFDFEGAGGGGAGHLTVGQDGVNDRSVAPGLGGPSYVSIPDELLGGSGGGGGSTESFSQPITIGGGGGGGGGGALRLIAQGTLTIGVSGIVDASGGDGGAGNGAGGGGAGSGGSIELRASVSPTVDGLLDVSGGIGGLGDPSAGHGGNGSDGRTVVGVSL